MNYFAKKNYARGQQKKRVEHIFDTLTDGFSKAQFEDLRSFQSVYNERFESLKMSFEEFVKVDEKVVNRSVELAIDAHLIEIENQLEEVNKKLASLKKYEKRK